MTTQQMQIERKLQIIRQALTAQQESNVEMIMGRIALEIQDAKTWEDKLKVVERWTAWYVTSEVR